MNVATIPPGGVAYAHIHVGFELMLYILQGRVRHEYGPGPEEGRSTTRRATSSTSSQASPTRCSTSATPKRSSPSWPDPTRRSGRISCRTIGRVKTRKRR